VPIPRTPSEAIAQGELIATQERQRIGLGATLPIDNVPALLSSQGVRTFAAELPDGVSGLSVQHPSIRPAILVNRRQVAAGRRFSLAHEYAHTLFDRKVGVTKRENSDELAEKRANAFAAAFLLPRLGIEEGLAGLNKGCPSRRTHVVFAVATGNATRAETRPAPGSQTVTFQDVATVARRFGTPYGAVVFRLLSLGMISETGSKDLLSERRQAAARRYEAVFGSEPQVGRARGAISIDTEEALGLKAEIVHLAVEGYRQHVVSKDRLASIAKRLELPELSEAKLVELAEAVR
jgi:Zn-dependent peptidase ImmA (M78 family)